MAGRKSGAKDAETFAKLRAKYLEQDAAASDLRSHLQSYYGGNVQWASAAQRKKLERLEAARDRTASKIFALIERVSPRDFSRGFPSYWVAGKLKWGDVLTTGALSETPPAAYGYSDRDMQALTGPVR